MITFEKMKDQPKKIKCNKTYGLLAQLVEHETLNPGVQGSSPWQSTKTTSIRTFAQKFARSMKFYNKNTLQ